MTEEIDNAFERLLWGKVVKKIYRLDSSSVENNDGRSRPRELPDLPFRLIEVWVVQVVSNR